MGLFSWRQRRLDPLDVPLLRWSKADFFTVRDLLNGGIVIFGRSGSGKTSGSGHTLLRAIIGRPNRSSGLPRSGGLILGAKPEDADDVRGIFEKAGRGDDLLVVNPDGELRLNFLDYVRSMGGDTREITRCITTIGENLRGSDSNGRENGDFWEQEQARMIFNAVEIVKLATSTVKAPDLQKFILTAAMSRQHVETEKWQAGYHNQCQVAAYRAPKTKLGMHDYELAVDYWADEFPEMSDRTRSSIMTGVMGILHCFNTGIVRELASTTTNCSPDDMLDGRWVLVNMPPAQYGDTGNFINAGWKYLTQRRILRRKAEPGDCINVIWVDECQQFVNSFDSHYLAQCRSHRGCMCFLTQSLHSIFSNLKGDAGLHHGLALLSNFSTRLFHSLGSTQDAEYASGLIGKKLQTFIGGSTAPDDDLFSLMMGGSKYTGSFNEHYESILQPNVFLNGLRTGGRANNLLTDAILVKSGEPFEDGRNWKYVTFSQT